MVLKRKKDFGKSEVLRAIDGARTRGLDLGKVAEEVLKAARDVSNVTVTVRVFILVMQD